MAQIVVQNRVATPLLLFEGRELLSHCYLRDDRPLVPGIVVFLLVVRGFVIQRHIVVWNDGRMEAFGDLNPAVEKHPIISVPLRRMVGVEEHVSRALAYAPFPGNGVGQVPLVTQLSAREARCVVQGTLKRRIDYWYSCILN